MEWVKQGKLDAKTESLMMAAQDGVLHTNAYSARVLKSRNRKQCRICGEEPETLGHILSACKDLKFKGIKDRHDRVLYCLLTEVTRSLGLKTPRRGPRGGAREELEGTEMNRLVVDLKLPTVESMDARKPDLVVRQVEEKKLMVGATLDRLAAQPEGDLSGRTRLRGKCSPQDKGLIERVEEAMMQELKERKYTTLWQLNSLEYAGAETVMTVKDAPEASH